MTDRWTLLPLRLETLPVHAALVPSGKVVFFSGSEHDEAPRAMSRTGLFDVSTNSVTYVDSPQDDLFCAGHCMLGNGDVFVAGGTARYDKYSPEPHKGAHHFTGINSCHIFDWRKEGWRTIASMAFGRWYPTCVTLADGRVLTMDGHTGGGAEHENNTVETYVEPAGWSPARVTNPELEDTGNFWYLGTHFWPMIYYPRLLVLPANGQVFSATALQVNGKRATRSLDPDTLALTTLGDPPPDMHVTAGSHIYSRAAFSSVLLPLRPPSYQSTVLICGAGQARKFELSRPHLGWQPAGGPRPYPVLYPMRAYNTAVLLPDGSVFVVGGGTERGPWDPPPWTERGGGDNTAIPWPERYLPDQDSWEKLSAPAYPPIPRMYHSVALLLPDGRVWIAGSNHDSRRNLGGVREDDPAKGDARELRVELYSPPYLFIGHDSDGNLIPATRPQIRRVRRGASYGQEFSIYTPSLTSRGPGVDKVVVVRCASVTHAFSSDQRYIELVIVGRSPGSDLGPGRDGVVRTVAPPDSRIAPPGYYMLFLLTAAGTPSHAAFFRIGVQYPVLQLHGGRPAEGELGLLVEPDEAQFPEDSLLHLGVVEFGQLAIGVVRCTNRGTGMLRVYDVTVSGHFRTEDTADSPLLGTRGMKRNTVIEQSSAAAGPAEAVEIKVTFTGDAYGTLIGALEFYTSAEDMPFVRIPLAAEVRGVALGFFPVVSGVPTLVFGDVPTGKTRSMNLQVHNVGSLDTAITFDPIAGPFAAPEYIPDNIVPKGRAREFPITFQPVGVGPTIVSFMLTADAVQGTTDYSEVYRKTYTVVLTGSGTGPQAGASPLLLDFGDQRVGTESLSRQVQIRNIGTAVLTIEGIDVGVDFRARVACPPLSPGEVCTADVIFRPGHGGALASTLEIRSNSFGPAVAIALAGTGLLEPVATIDRAELNFGPRPIGVGGPPLAVTMTNSGGVPLHVQSATVGSANDGDFRITDRCSNAELHPEAKCEISVEFRPTAPGLRTADLQIIDDSADSPHIIVLTGAGIIADEIVVDPVAISFGPQRVGAPSRSRTATVRNEGTSPLTVQKIDVLGLHTTDFIVASGKPSEGTLPRALAPGDSWEIGIVFNPTAIGARNAALVVSDGVVRRRTTQVPMEGVGEAAQVQFMDEHMAVTIHELVFSAQLLNTFSSARTIYAVNVGNVSFVVASVMVQGDFVYRSLCPSLLEPGSSCVIQIVFSPTAKGRRGGQLVIMDGTEPKTYALSLSGDAAAPIPHLMPMVLDFGAVIINSTSGERSVELANIGDWPLSITSVRVTGPHAGAFFLTSSNCESSVLRAGQKCTVELAFSPAARGDAAAELEFVTNASLEPLSVTLRGSGRSSWRPIFGLWRRFRG